MIALSIDDVGLEWPTLLGQDYFSFVEVKVDRQLIAGCADSERMQEECRRILGHVVRVGARSVAQGVETRSDLSAVHQMGFDLVQGFLLAKPITAQKLCRTMLRQATVTLQ